MNNPIINSIKKALEHINDPYLGLAFSEICQFSIDDKNIIIYFPYLVQTMQKELETKIAPVIQAVLDKENIKSKYTLKFDTKIVHRSVQNELKPLENIKNIIAISSGKGGVGKSTVAVNLTLALNHLGAKVGLVDADIYGPSLPTIFDQFSQPKLENNKFIPLDFNNIKFNSMGLLVPNNMAIMWRGPMISKVFEQLVNDTLWQNLDFLLIDLPAGTGDIQLSMAQKVPLAGIITVTTPQDVALADVCRSVEMFNKLKVKHLGVVENMAYHICENCGHQSHIFGQSRAQAIADRFKLDLIASLPLDKAICEMMDNGSIKKTDFNDLPFHQQYLQMAKKLTINLAKLPKDEKHKFPNISLQ